MNVYVTSDAIGTETGGGKVTLHEFTALGGVGPAVGPSPETLTRHQQDVWDPDRRARAWLADVRHPRLAHFYSGTFPETVGALRDLGAKVTYTIAAHDRKVSQREFEQTWGWPFNLPHLTDPNLWRRYIEGYRQADVIICPSTAAAETVRGYGKEFTAKRIEVVPHGCDLPTQVTRPPRRFRVGYMGALGPDKGVPYLLQAWKKLNYPDADLVLAGRDSGTDMAKDIVARWGGGNVVLLGWVNRVSDFYNQVSCYVQPSATEGYGIEVVEAMAHCRPVVCSAGAGAVDLVPADWAVPACAVDALAAKIDAARALPAAAANRLIGHNRRVAEQHTWERVRERYQTVWQILDY